MVAKAQKDSQINVTAINLTVMDFNIVGVSPLVPHAMSAKNALDLLFPPQKKNAAEKASTMKHEPWDEFRHAAYKFRDTDDEPTRLYMPGTCYHAALAEVAIDMVGASKSQIGRLTSVPQEKVPVYGVPQIWATIVRSSDMKRTPDVRCLPILPRWATRVSIQFPSALIKEQSVANLLANAGIINGIGDGRPGKGKLTMGKWRLCDDDDEEFLSIIAEGGRAAQDVGLANPAYFDIETEQLLEAFKREVARRAAMPAQQRRSKKPAADAAVVATQQANGGGVQPEA